MKVIDFKKLRDLFYWGINDKPVISPEVDKIIINIIDNCTVENTEINQKLDELHLYIQERYRISDDEWIQYELKQLDKKIKEIF